MGIPADIEHAIVAAYGVASATVLAARHGITRGQVLALWHRRRNPASAEPEAPTAFDPRGFIISGIRGAVWLAMVDAGERGAGAEEIRDRIYAKGKVPPTWRAGIVDHVRILRRFAEPHGYTIAPVPDVAPPRWRIDLVEEALPPPPRPVCRLRFTGTAAAVEALTARCCRWIDDDVGDGPIRFCTEAKIDGKPYCRDHARRTSGGIWAARRAA